MIVGAPHIERVGAFEPEHDPVSVVHPHSVETAKVAAPTRQPFALLLFTPGAFSRARPEFLSKRFNTRSSKQQAGRASGPLLGCSGNVTTAGAGSSSY